MLSHSPLDQHFKTALKVAGLREWFASRCAPSGSRAAGLAGFPSMVAALVRVIRSTFIPLWMNKPISALSDDKPIERIAAATTARWRC